MVLLHEWFKPHDRKPSGAWAPTQSEDCRMDAFLEFHRPLEKNTEPFTWHTDRSKTLGGTLMAKLSATSVVFIRKGSETRMLA